MDDFTQMGMEFITFANLIRREMDMCGSHQCLKGMKTPNAKFLGYLFQHRNKDVFQKDLEEAFSIRPSTVSRSLKNLEEQGYIVRTAASCDSRLKRITLTEKSEKISEFCNSVFAEILKKMTDNIPDAEIEALLKTMRKMKENLEAAQE